MDTRKQLIDFVIGRLNELKSRGNNYVIINPAVLNMIKSPKSIKSTRQQTAASFKTETKMTNKPELPSKSVLMTTDTKIDHTQPGVITTQETISSKETSFESGSNKNELIKSLAREVLSCTKCPHLVKARKNVVFGVGTVDAELMFIGEAPGADEDAQGEPFVGLAGQLLTRIIIAMGLSRDRVYIANILKCRPDTPNQTSGNRKPTLIEMQTCFPYLKRQIEIIQPKVIVALGATAVEGLFGKQMPITKVRGELQYYNGIPVIPTYHPAYLLRNQTKAAKRQVWEDMLKAMELLKMPISEKQRGYFL
jgi:DNA polymerase